MHFDHDRIGSGGHGGEGHLRHKLPQANSVRWIHHYRQMRFRLQDGNRAEIECITRGVFEGANTSFAQEHIHVSFAQDVFSAHDQLADCRA